MTLREFEHLYATGQGALKTLLGRSVPRDHVDDLAQDTFLVAWTKRRQIAPPGYRFLHGIGRRVVAHHVRHFQVEQRCRAEVMAERGPMAARLSTLAAHRNRHKYKRKERHVRTL